MIGSAAFVSALEGYGVRLMAGVPCSYFAGPLRLLERGSGPRYVPAVNEGSALAVAAGARLSGEPAAVIAQNSGFGNLINPLTSLVLPYRIPLLVMMSMRGWPTASDGEPQHRWMGEVVPEWLASMNIPHWTLTADGPSFATLLKETSSALDAGQPAFILVGKGAIANERDEPAEATRPLPSRDDLVDAVIAEVRDEYVLSTTGFLSRSLFNRGERSRNFYMQGSMGHVSGLALGSALTRPDDRFVVLDGDGAALMHLGVLATVGHHAPRNLVHLVFDNGVYASTGGQAAVSADFPAVARGCGYRHVRQVETVEELRPAIRAALGIEGPVLLAVRGSAVGDAGERASSSLSVEQIAQRFTSEFEAR